MLRGLRLQITTTMRSCTEHHVTGCKGHIQRAQHQPPVHMQGTQQVAVSPGVSAHTPPPTAFQYVHSLQRFLLCSFCIELVHCIAAPFNAELLTLPTLLTCICSSGTYLTKPDTIVRGSASPTSIFSTYRLRMGKQCGMLVQAVAKWSFVQLLCQSLPQSYHPQSTF